MLQNIGFFLRHTASSNAYTKLQPKYFSAVTIMIAFDMRNPKLIPRSLVLRKFSCLLLDTKRRSAGRRGESGHGPDKGLLYGSA